MIIHVAAARSFGLNVKPEIKIYNKLFCPLPVDGKKIERPSMNPVDASCSAAAKESSALQAGSKCMNYRDARIGKPVRKGNPF